MKPRSRNWPTKKSYKFNYHTFRLKCYPFNFSVRFDLVKGGILLKPREIPRDSKANYYPCENHLSLHFVESAIMVDHSRIKTQPQILRFAPRKLLNVRKMKLWLIRTFQFPFWLVEFLKSFEISNRKITYENNCKLQAIWKDPQTVAIYHVTDFADCNWLLLL